MSVGHFYSILELAKRWRCHARLSTTGFVRLAQLNFV